MYVIGGGGGVGVGHHINNGSIYVQWNNRTLKLYMAVQGSRCDLFTRSKASDV